MSTLRIVESMITKIQGWSHDVTMQIIANTDQANSKSLVWRHTLSHDPVWVAMAWRQKFIQIIVLVISQLWFALEIPF
jgi:hypothetical protein